MIDDMDFPEKLYDLKEGEIGRGEYFLDESGNMVKNACPINYKGVDYLMIDFKDSNHKGEPPAIYEPSGNAGDGGSRGA